MRAALLASVLLLACGASETAPTAPAPPPEAPPPEAPPPAEPTAGPDRCEGLVAGCGGWVGCITVRRDPHVADRFVGVGASAGHFYVPSHACFEGTCNVVCGTGGTGPCRPGLTETDVDVECSGAVAPSVAPFTCERIDGVCTRGPDPGMAPTS